ncbi:hypothetical protein HHL22_20685 [Hymenobacter sp. RP-2-7]|uniref:Uncharacterized protein n=1 Tax=Hymenobacter polaris TaxID=2682546 RepID=A0A7Y0AIB4_9BACT|nr:hypothetical protein [Hymenobacter polaris]NML67625.1 hypothetical protein [Hymenobacter polaris]
MLIYLTSEVLLAGWGDFWLFLLGMLGLFGLAMWQKVKRVKADEQARIRAYRKRKD